MDSDDVMLDADGAMSDDEPLTGTYPPPPAEPAAQPPYPSEASSRAAAVKPPQTGRRTADILHPQSLAEDNFDEEEAEDTVLQRTMRKVFESKDEDLDDQFYTHPTTGHKSKFTKRMYKLVELLNTEVGLYMLKNAVRVNMRFKVDRYMKMREKIEKRQAIEREKYERMQEGIRRDANLKDDEDNWRIFDKLGDQLVELEKQHGSLLVIEDRARELLNEDKLDTDGIDANNTTIRTRRDELVNALDRLAFYNQQPMILEAVSEIVYGFLINPSFVRRKFMNFLFAGPAGTGKTSIVREISAVFSVAGIFVFNTVVEGGRNDFIAPYEGQTVGKTMTFLTSGLDSGVIFVDEAYSITTWDKGVPSSYGAEATAAMVDFMTKYKGLYCLMFAGYETEMRRYFLEANEGLPRRIPYQYRLKDYNSSQLVQIYKRTLLTEMGVPDSQVNENSIKYIESAFTRETWVWLAKFVTYVRDHQKWYYKKPQFDSKTRRYYEREIKIVPKFKYMWEIFKNQAGAMTNLAEATVVALINTVDPGQLTLLHAVKPMQLDEDDGGSSGPGSSSDTPDPSPNADKDARTIQDLEATRKARFLFKRGNSLSMMKALIKHRIMNTFMSEAPLFLEEFRQVDGLASIATDTHFEELLRWTRADPKVRFLGKDYVDNAVTIDVSSEEVYDGAYEIVKKAKSKPKTQKSKPGEPSEEDFKAMSENARQKDLLQIKYCAGSYFHGVYSEWFSSAEGNKLDGWWNGKHEFMLTKIRNAIQKAYRASHHTGEPLKKDLIGYIEKSESVHMFEPANYRWYYLETYLSYVDEYLDVELTLSYFRPNIGEIRKPKYQLRLINKAGFDPYFTDEETIVFSVGVPFFAFRPETDKSVLTRVLNVGEEYVENYFKQIAILGRMAGEALEAMQQEYKIVMLGEDPSKGVELQKTRYWMARGEGLPRLNAFEDGKPPYAWASKHQLVTNTVNTPKDIPPPQLEKPKVPSRKSPRRADD